MATYDVEIVTERGHECGLLPAIIAFVPGMGTLHSANNSAAQPTRIKQRRATTFPYIYPLNRRNLSCNVKIGAFVLLGRGFSALTRSPPVVLCYTSPKAMPDVR
jgi:hypothetical protein